MIKGNIANVPADDTPIVGKPQSRTQISHGHMERRSGKVRFRACSVPARPEIRAFLSLRMFVLSVVILGDFVE